MTGSSDEIKIYFDAEHKAWVTEHRGNKIYTKTQLDAAKMADAIRFPEEEEKEGPGE